MPGQKEYFIVSEIVGHRETDQGVEYRVNWSGYPSSADTWEPENNLKNCEEFIQQYIMSNLRGKKPRRSIRLAQASSEEDIHEIDAVVSPVSTTSRTQKVRQQTRIKTRQKYSASPAPEQKVKSYGLRSGSSHKHITGASMSGDQGGGATVPLLTPTKPQPKPKLTESRELTEARFRHSQRMADISKRRPFSSTPFTRSARRQTTTTTKMSSDDVLGLRATILTPAPNNEPLTLGQADSSDDVMEADEDEDEMEIGEEEGEGEETQNQQSEVQGQEQNKLVRRSRWDLPDFDLGWKEVALTLFLSGIGVLGYICYYNDVCTYC